MRLDGESDTFCVNVDCPGQRVQRIAHFASRGAMDIEHLGERTVCAVLRGRPARRRRRHLLTRLRAVSAFEGWGDTSVANLRGGYRGLEAPAAGQPSRRAVDPPPGRRRSSGPRPALPPPRPDHGGDGRGAGGRRRGRAGDRRQRRASSSPWTATGRSSSDCGCRVSISRVRACPTCRR